jgi:hypothetical protein
MILCLDSNPSVNMPTYIVQPKTSDCESKARKLFDQVVTKIDTLDENLFDELHKFLKVEYSDVCSGGDVINNKFIDELFESNGLDEITFPDNDYGWCAISYVLKSILAWKSGDVPDPYWAS